MGSRAESYTAASAKTILRIFRFPNPHPTLSFLPRYPRPTEIRYDRDPVSHLAIGD